MTTSYIVIQYTPDPATGERLNVGIAAWSADNVSCRFTNNWRRLRTVAPASDLTYLQEFVEHFTGVVRRSNACSAPEAASGTYFQEKMISSFHENWASKIHFTEPRGSLRDPDTTISRLSKLFVSIISDDRVRRRTRSTAISLTVRALRSAVAHRLSKPDIQNYIMIRPDVPGQLENHILDVGLKNGKLISGVHALSFESQDAIHLEREVESTAYVLNDVMKATSPIEVSVFALPPTVTTEGAFKRAEKLFRAMKVPLIEEGSLEKWAAQQAEELAIHVERVGV
jgi:hypothetical protein